MSLSLFACAAALFFVRARASYEPGAPWPTAGHDNLRSGAAAVAGPAVLPTLAWASLLPSGALTNAQPTISAEGLVYFSLSCCGFGANAGVVAVPAATGTPLMPVQPIQGAVLGSVSIGAAGVCYAASTSGLLHSFTCATGGILASWQTTDQLQSTPIISNDSALVLAGCNNGQLWAYRTSGGAGGNVAWRAGQNGFVRGGAVQLGGAVFFGSESGAAAAVSVADGSLLWPAAFTAPASITGAPCISADGAHVYFPCENGFIYALRTEDGSLAWQFKTLSTQYSSLVCAGGRVIVAPTFGDPSAYAIDGTTGAAVWQSVALGLGVQWNSAVVDAVGSVFVSAGSTLYCLSAIDGSIIWQYAYTGGTMSPPALDAEGVIYISSGNYLLRLQGPSPSPSPSSTSTPAVTSSPSPSCSPSHSPSQAASPSASLSRPVSRSRSSSASATALLPPHSSLSPSPSPSPSAAASMQPPAASIVGPAVGTAMGALVITLAVLLIYRRRLALAERRGDLPGKLRGRGGSSAMSRTFRDDVVTDSDDAYLPLAHTADTATSGSEGSRVQ